VHVVLPAKKGHDHEEYRCERTTIEKIGFSVVVQGDLQGLAMDPFRTMRKDGSEVTGAPLNKVHNLVDIVEKLVRHNKSMLVDNGKLRRKNQTDAHGKKR
jgi:NCAIR mutase (PurE)-related protein